MALHSPHNRRKTKKTLQPKYKNLDNKLNKLAQTQTKTPTDTHTFFPRVVNKTNILFSNNELKLLEKGPKYNIHSHKRNWLTTLALEAETSITHLPSTDCDYFRKQVAIRIEEGHNKPKPHKNTHPELRNLSSIQTKRKSSDAMIASAGKGNSLVVLPIQQYDAKVQNFIDKNNFLTSTANPTKSFQNQITINRSPNLIPNSKWKFINLNPSAPTMKGLIKLHKPDHPIRPVVN